MVVPVIDLFAGPGGLGEGFASFHQPEERDGFRIALSIEKDTTAHETLMVRSFYRQFSKEEVPAAYFKLLRGQINLPELFSAYPKEAKNAASIAWYAELGRISARRLEERINAAICGHDPWVLIGGPPCQAYSIVGRARNKGIANYKLETDATAYLYQEYLNVIARHWPAVFVMENVKGILSSKMEGRLLFGKILDDLRDPGAAVRRKRRPRERRFQYKLYSLTKSIRSLNGSNCEQLDPEDFVVCSENFGIPQARHRVILVGVRDDLRHAVPRTLRKQDPIALSKVLSGLPRLRSGLSKEKDAPALWRARLTEAAGSAWMRDVRATAGLDVKDRIVEVLGGLSLPRANRGLEYMEADIDTDYRPQWYLDSRIGGVCNHTSRAHIVSDLHRYVFVSSYGVTRKTSPHLQEFPPQLLPAHKNVSDAVKSGRMFSDRFRVQIWGRPATTVTSHIAKDGHYYIHPDPTQCRSLTVREAARIQTFPDNYVFCGPRTEQYAQVGNAVPPLLARQIAEIVHELLRAAR